MSQQNEAAIREERSFIEQLGHQLGMTANVKLIYGEPVEREGVTVIPVARVAYGFGGGSGKREEQEGSGGGGGMMLTPVGYIEIKNGYTRFRRTPDPLGLALGLLAAAPPISLAVWTIVRLLRR